MITHVPDKNLLSEVADNILNTLNKSTTISNIEVTVTVSVGIAFFPSDGKTADELLANADVAMYHAKELGRNQYAYYRQELNKDNIARFERINELRAALKNEEFFLEYQPQLNVSTNKIIVLEALIRWRHPTKGVIYPIDFIQFSEDSGLIIPISNWILHEACRQNKEWQESALPPIRVAINIFSKQFAQIDFPAHILNVLKETPVQIRSATEG